MDQNPRVEETPLRSSCGIETLLLHNNSPQAEQQLQAMQKITSNLLQIMHIFTLNQLQIMQKKQPIKTSDLVKV